MHTHQNLSRPDFRHRHRLYANIVDAAIHGGLHRHRYHDRFIFHQRLPGERHYLRTTSMVCDVTFGCTNCSEFPILSGQMSDSYDSGAAPICATNLPSSRARISDAFALFLANCITLPHNHGLTATCDVKAAVRNRPFVATNRSIFGNFAPYSSEITFTASKAMPCACATRATAAASISTATAPYALDSLAFCAASAIVTSLTRIALGAPGMSATAAPLASMTREGRSTSPTRRLRSTAPA